MPSCRRHTSMMRAVRQSRRSRDRLVEDVKHITVPCRHSIVPALDGWVVSRDLDDVANEKEGSFGMDLSGTATFRSAADRTLKAIRAGRCVVVTDAMIGLVIGKGALRPRLRLLEKVSGSRQDLFGLQCRLLFADLHPECMQGGKRERGSQKDTRGMPSSLSTVFRRRS